MSKRVRRWIFALAGLFVLLVIAALAIVLNPGVQTSFVRRILRAADPDAKIENVAFGFSGGQIKGLEIHAGGSLVKADELRLRFSIWNLLFGKVYVIDDLRADNLVIDVASSRADDSGEFGGKSRRPDAGSRDGSQPGATPLLIKNATISATLLLPEGRSAQFAFEGRDLGAGSTGHADAELTFRDLALGAKVSEMRGQISLDATFTDDMFAQNLGLTANLSAQVAGRAQPARLVARLEAKPESGKAGEFSFVVSDPAEADATSPALLAVKGDYGADGSGKGTVAADISHANIEPFALGFTLPDFDIVASGEWASSTATGEVSLKGKLAGNLGQLGAVRPNLESLGTVQLAADVDLAWADRKFSGRALTATLAPIGGGTALTARLLTPFTLERDGNNVKFTQGSGVELVRLTLDNAPAGWLALLLPAEFGVTGRTITGEVVAGRRADGAIVANTVRAFTASGLAVTRDKNALLGGGYVEFDSEVIYTPGDTAGKVQTIVRKLLCSADTVQTATGVARRTGAGGAIVTAQYAGNFTTTVGSGQPQYGGDGRLAMAWEIDQMDRQAFGAELPAVAPTGRILLDATFDAARAAKSWDIISFQANVTKGAATLASAKVAQLISLPIGADGRPSPPSASGDLATIEITGLPMALFQPFFGKERKVTGIVERGRFIFSGAGEAGFEFHAEQPLTIANIQYSDAGQARYANVTLTLAPTGRWRADGLTSRTVVNAASPAGVLLRGTLDFTEAGAQWSANVTADGRLAALAAQPFGAEWRAMLANPAPEYTLSANIARSADALVVNRAVARILPPGATGSAIGEAELTQPLRLAADAGGKYAWPKLQGDAATVDLHDVPAGVIGLLLPGCLVQGRGITGNIVVSGDGAGGYTMASKSNVSFANLTLTLTPNGKPPAQWLRDLTLSARPTIRFNNTGITYIDVRGLSLTAGSAPIGQGDIEMAFRSDRAWWQQAKVNLRADLGLLTRQPLLGGFKNIEDGTIELDAESGADGAVRLNLRATSWKVRAPVATVRMFAFNNVTGRFDADKGGFQLAGSLIGQNAKGATDSAFTVVLGPAGLARDFSFSLTGNGLVVDDLQAMARALTWTAAGPAQAPAAPAAPAAPDTAAFWGGLQGRASVQLRQMVYGGFVLDGVQAAADFTPARVSVSSATARFSNAPISLNGTLAFDASRAEQPYDLQANLSMSGFDVGQYFRNRNAGAKPPAEGQFSVAGTASGRGANADELLARAPFELNLGSDGGVFHVLDLVTNRPTLTGGVLRAGQIVTGIAAGLLGQTAPKAGDGLMLFNELLTSLDTVEYNQLVLVARRGADGNIEITRFDVRNTLVQLAGTGTIQYLPGVSIPDQPLVATLQLNANGRPAQILSGAGLLRAGPAVGGYQPGPQFQVTGSMQNLNYGALYNLLLQGVAGGVLNQLK